MRGIITYHPNARDMLKTRSTQASGVHNRESRCFATKINRALECDPRMLRSGPRA